MDDGPELISTRTAPIILGQDDGGEPLYVAATGYGYGFRKGQVGYVVGDLVDEALDSFLLVPAEDSDTGTTALAHPGSQRAGETVPELGFQIRLGTDADVTAFTAEQSDDPAGAREAATPASIHDDQSDRRPYNRRRDTAESVADSRAVADSNAHASQFDRNPNAEMAPEGTYDLDAPATAKRGPGRPRKPVA